MTKAEKKQTIAEMDALWDLLNEADKMAGNIIYDIKGNTNRTRARLSVLKDKIRQIKHDLFDVMAEA